MSKTSTGLVEFVKQALNNGAGYVYGTFGQTCTTALLDAKAKQYPANNLAGGSMRKTGEKWMGKRVMDCVGLIKYYLWSDGYGMNPVYNSSQDKSANGMLSACLESGSIGSMPDIPGILVFMPGHVGVYIGNGEVIESKGTAYGVVKTIFKGRGWKNWGKCPYISYTSQPSSDITDSQSSGTYHYSTGDYKIIVDGLRVRTGPGTNYAVKSLNQLTASAQAQGGYKKGVIFTAQEVQNLPGESWAKSPSGWVCLQNKDGIYCEPNENTRPAEEPKPVAKVGYCTTKLLNVRSGPGTGNSVVFQIAKGNEVNILSDCGNGWYYIECLHGKGYCSAEYISTNAPVETKAKTLTVTGSLVNVRTGPGNGYKVVFQVAKGNQLNQLDYSNGWYKINCLHGDGWIIDDHVVEN